MIVLGIDPGSAGGMGWALMSSLPAVPDPRVPKLLDSGAMTVRMSGGADDRSALWHRLHRLLHDLYTSPERPGLIAYERVMRHSGVHAAHIHGGQIAVIQQFCRFHRLPWTPVHVMTVKAVLRLRAAGRGKTVAGVDAVHALGYTEVTDHNEADAVGVALAGLDQWKTGKNVFGR